MEFREIVTFMEVAQLKSFSRAAEKLGYSQAAVTIQIKHLEQELGARLFDRIGKQVTLTHQGVVFTEHAGRLITDMARARTALSEPSELSGRLCIGTIESICATIFPDLLKEYHRLYPRVSVSIVTGSPDKLLDMMNCNALDIVYFLDKKMYDPKWVKALEVPDRVIFVTSADNPLANASISLEEMIRQPFILTEKDASYRLLLEQHLASLELDIHLWKSATRNLSSACCATTRAFPFCRNSPCARTSKTAAWSRFTSRALPCASGNRSSTTRISG